jgi:hypothetical protein
MNRVAGDSHPIFTPRQGQYLAFIHAYTLVNGLDTAAGAEGAFILMRDPACQWLPPSEGLRR